MINYKKITIDYKNQVFDLIKNILKDVRDEWFIPYDEWEYDNFFDEKNYGPIFGAFDGDKLV